MLPRCAWLSRRHPLGVGLLGTISLSAAASPDVNQELVMAISVSPVQRSTTTRRVCLRGHSWPWKDTGKITTRRPGRRRLDLIPHVASPQVVAAERHGACVEQMPAVIGAAARSTAGMRASGESDDQQSPATRWEWHAWSVSLG